VEIGNDLGAEWIEMEIPDEFEGIGVFFHHDGLVPLLEEMPHPRVSAVEGPGVAREEGAHAAGERALSGADQEVGMVRQERPGVDRPGPLCRQVGHAGDKVGAVRVVAEANGSLDPSHHDVVKGLGRIEAGLTRHGASLL
jgi:hypothetical protein